MTEDMAKGAAAIVVLAIVLIVGFTMGVRAACKDITESLQISAHVEAVNVVTALRTCGTK